MTFSRFSRFIVRGVQAYEGPRLYTQQDIDLFNSGLDIRLWGHRIRFTGTSHRVGDPVVRSASFWDLFKGLAAALDDYVFRPIVEVSPIILGAVIGVGSALYLGIYAGIGLSATSAYIATKLPGGSYLGRLFGGIALGSGVVSIIRLAMIDHRFPRLTLGSASAAIGTGGTEISSLWFVSPFAALMNEWLGLGY